MAKRHKRYTEQERAQILAAAQQQGLNGVQAAKKFGISTLTYYTWKKRAKGGRRGAAAKGARGDATNGSLTELLRAQVQDQIRAMLPEIVREEVARALAK